MNVILTKEKKSRKSDLKDELTSCFVIECVVDQRQSALRNSLCTNIITG